jgi:CHAD domain-containing protein
VARAREVEFDCDAPFAVVAARVVEVRSEEVFAQAEGVLDLGDVERVHDMRVATRRLRAALEIFAPAFPRKRHRKALKRVKALADALGARRDLDVEIELLENLARPGRDALSTHVGDNALQREESVALSALLGELRTAQRRANEGLAPFVADKRLRKLRRRLKKLVEAGR